MLAQNHRFWLILNIVVFWVVLGIVEPQPTSSSSSSSEAKILQKFKQSLTNTDALKNWDTSIPPCNGNTRNWAGVLCFKGRLRGLRLENMNLSGLIDINALVQLSQIRTISFMNNSFNGPFPAINKLGWLRSLFFSYNNFSGELSNDAFEGMRQLRKVYLGHNSFTGMVPKSLVELPRLLELSIEDNKFVGHVPTFNSNEFRILNLSDNFFDGRIPPTLSHMNSSSFLGNPGLCGEPLPPCPKSNSLPMTLIIVITIAVLLIMTGIFLLVVRHRNRKLGYNQSTSPRDHDHDLEGLPQEKSRIKKQSQFNGYDLYPNNQSRALERPTSYKKSDNGKLCFLRNDRHKFEMQDLLKASAEVLGSGSFGSSYKAAIVNGPAFVVKRFKQMNNVGKEEFQEHMKRLGRLRHPNILPLVAFFHKRDEKLIISDFVENGSLASHLHGRRTPDQEGLKWLTRLKIIKGVARGLAYLYRELPELSLPHGHLKSSNVLLDDNFEPLLSDYGLAPLVNQDHAEQVMVAYKSPEFTQTNMTTKKTDVWCLGILILEVLTGQFPANYLKPGKGGNDELATWVNSVASEAELTRSNGDMFDVDMRGPTNSKGEMLKLLKVGMMCCEWSVEKRWFLREVVEKIEELKENDRDDDGDHEFLSYGSGRELYSTISSISQEEVPFRE